MGNGVREGQVDFKRQDAEPVTSTHLPSEVRADCWVYALGLREELRGCSRKETAQWDYGCGVLKELQRMCEPRNIES